MSAAAGGPFLDLGCELRVRVAAGKEIGDRAVTLGAIGAIEREDSVEVVYLVLQETCGEPVAHQFT